MVNHWANATTRTSHGEILMNTLLIQELQLHEYLREQLIEKHSDIDEETLNDTLEGMTSLHEKLAAVIRSQQHDSDISKALKERICEMRERLKRFENRMEKKRELVTYVMECADIQKINEPDFSASLRLVPPSLHVSDETAIPDEFWKPQPPKLDRQALLTHLKANHNVPGAFLNNGAQTVSIRTK